MKLFVDDIRRCPDGWHLARTVSEAIRCLATMDFKEVSLDHDITCVEVAKMAQEDGKPAGFHRYHSSAETFEPVAHYLSLMCKAYAVHQYAHHCVDGREETAWPVKVTFHTGNIEAGREMAQILGMDYKFRDYPSSFIEGSCSCKGAKKCTYCEAYHNLIGKWPGEHGEELS
jgi:hypothetical protein